MLLKGLFFGFVLAAMVGPMGVAGVFLGSAAWWLVLVGGVSALRTRLSTRLLRGINVVSGVTILGFALWQLAGLLR